MPSHGWKPLLATVCRRYPGLGCTGGDWPESWCPAAARTAHSCYVPVSLCLLSSSNLLITSVECGVLAHITAALCRCWRVHATDRLCLPSLHECCTLGPEMSAALVGEVSFYQCWCFNFTADFPGEQKKTPLVKQHYNYLKPVEVTWIIHPTYFLALPSVQCPAGCSWAMQWRAWRLAGGHMSPHLALTRHQPLDNIYITLPIKQ